MIFRLEDLNEDCAKQICTWKYGGDCSVYNVPKWDIMVSQKWAITINKRRQDEFKAVIDENKELCGYIRFINKDEYVLVGLGLKPSLCGQGYGKSFMELLKLECCKKYGSKKIVLEVRSFNERAIRCYKRAGFKIVDAYDKDTLIGKGKFIRMEFSPKK